MTDFISNSAIPPLINLQRGACRRAQERPGVPKMAEFGIKSAKVRLATESFAVTNCADRRVLIRADMAPRPY